MPRDMSILRLSRDDHQDIDALLALVDPLREAYRSVLDAPSSGRPTHVALVLGSTVVKAMSDYEAVVVLAEEGYTAQAATIARAIVESAVNMLYLTSLHRPIMSEECLRFGLHGDVDSLRWGLVQEGLGKLRRADEWVGPGDLNYRTAAVGKMIAPAEAEESAEAALAVLRSWERSFPNSRASKPGIVDRSKATIADPVVISNVCIAYRLCYQSFSGFGHGPDL
jgi:hypothetical protein